MLKPVNDLPFGLPCAIGLRIAGLGVGQFKSELISACSWKS
jgi:hypothetical protein